MASRVLLAFPLADARAEAELARHAEIVAGVGATPAEFAERIADVDAVILRPPAKLDAAAIAGAPKLKVIANIGSGVDHIDIAAANARGIPVVSGAGANANAVAEFALCGIILAHRKIYRAINDLSADRLDWPTRVGPLRGHEIGATTLGIVGFGHIGKALARMAAQGFGMQVAVFDPYLSEAPEGVDLLCGSLEELLRASTTVSVHVPLTEETRHLIGATELALLGPGGVIVNTSRGGVVDEEAVMAALRSGQLAGAVWDVFEHEPPSTERIAELSAVPGLIASPHIGGISHEAGSALSWAAVNGVLEVIGR
jgi:D-3-phosphoglycerate dehydrogenase